MLGSNAIQSLLNKDIKCIFDLEQDSSTGNLELINSNNLLIIGNVLHSIKIMPSEKKMEVSFIKHKRERERSIKDEDLNIILKQSKLVQNNSEINNIKAKVESFNQIIEERKRFYNQPHISRYLSLNAYESLLAQMNRQANSNTSISFQSFFNCNNSFSSSDISPNELVNTPDIPLITPNSLFNYLFATVENRFTKYGNDTIFFTGEKGMGKTSTLMLYSYLLRLNPYNLVISIFNYKLFIDNPFYYLFNEILFGLTPLFIYNSNTNVNSVISIYTDYSDIQLNNKHYSVLKLFQHMCTLIFNQIYRILVDYNREISFYFIIDDYDQFTKDDLEYIAVIKSQIEILKLNQWGIMDSKNIKLILCGTNSTRAIINQIEELKEKGHSIEKILNEFIVYLQPQQIFKCEELYAYFKPKLLLLEQDKKCIFELIKLANWNFSLINALLKDKQDNVHLIQFKIKEKLKAIYLSEFDNQFIKLSNIEKLELIYHIFSYKELDQIVENYTYSFSTKNYLNYNYSIVIPYISSINSTICFKFVNRIWKEICQSFNFNYYYPQVDFTSFTLEFFKNKYETTKSRILQGILLEEIAHKIYYNKLNHQGNLCTFSHSIPIFIYAQNDGSFPHWEKINPSFNKEDNQNITMPIDTVFQSETYDKDVFTYEKISLLKNGIYFLSHTFPLIDAFIIDNTKKHIILVQIKKQLIINDIKKTMQSFNLLYLLMDNETVRNEIKAFINQYNSKQNNIKFHTKVSVINTIAELALYKGYSFNFLFSYIQRNKEIDIDIPFTKINQQFKIEYPSIDVVLKNHQWKSCSKLNGVYEFDQLYSKLIIRNTKPMKNIAMCSLDSFVKELDIKNNSFFVSLPN